MKSLVLVTGAKGFIGRRLCQSFEEQGFAIRAAVRELSRATGLPKTTDVAAVGAIGKDTDWSDALRGVDTVVHLAARVHVLRERIDLQKESPKVAHISNAGLADL